ncbi:MAG: methylenetetrahydrofolate reductase [Actinomycetota bacterium]
MARIAERLASGPTLSFEFFPPKTTGAQLTLGRTVAAVEPLKPDFVSVTYGAGGSDRHRTGDVVTWMRRETDLEPMAHLTCVGHHRDEVASLLVEYRRLGVENILALGGDPPKDGHVAGDYQFASDLIADVAAPGCFSVGVAAHPEVHPRSPDRASDRRHLADKLAIADFAITQFFFEVEHYIRLVDELSDLGVDKPVVPGVMPIANLVPIQRMAATNGTEIPQWLSDRIARADDPGEVARIGTEVAIDLAAQLLDAGAPGIHLYTLNRPDAAQHVCAALDLRHD